MRCWFAPHDIVGGRKIHEQLDEAIRVHEKLLLVLSPHSMRSEWVKTEIRKARKREKHEREHQDREVQILFPVSLAPFKAIEDWEFFDADTGKDSAVEIREYFIPDFSTWETSNPAYQTAFAKLLAGLQAKQSRSAAKT